MTGTSVHEATVAEVMHPGVVCAHEEADFKQLSASLARNQISLVPVIDQERRVVGVVSASDLITHLVAGASGSSRGHRYLSGRSARRKSHAVTARELMSAPAITTTAGTSVVEAARAAVDSRVSHLPVVDADSGLVGIVSRTDLLRVFLRDDDEIARDLKRFLREVLVVEPDCVEVRVQDGIVELSGEMENPTLKHDLARYTRELRGVVDVVDHLSSRKDDQSPWPPTLEVR